MEIKKIKRKYKNEWLLIKVTVADEKDQPIEGQVILHSKNRDEIYEAQKNLKDYLYVTYSGEMPKKGFAVAFYG
ncbi:MAG: hypothetical protein Q8N80_05775 [Candidatus Omnitrophota bacterium]|jgi:hypothetical protein|nr:hypothetical protein [Candidatus Omnitrophota bacterium]